MTTTSLSGLDRMKTMTAAQGGRRGAPPPPPDLMAELMEAGRTGDRLRYSVARAAYIDWAADHGWNDQHGNWAADRSYR